MAKTTIHSDYIPDNAITSTKIAENSIGAREIATNAITTLYVADGSVTTVKIADDAITSAKLGSALTLGGNTTFSGDIIKDSGTLTLDSPVDLTLDADSGNIFLKDGGTHFGTLQNNSSDFRIVSIVQDKDIIFRGNQGGSFMEAMRIDISAGGTVGIGHNSPSSFSSGANNLVVNDTAGAGGITIVTPNDAKGSIFFADSTSATGQGRIRYNHDGDYMTFGTSGSEDKLVINSAGNVGIGTSSPQKALDIAGASTSGGGVMRLSGTGSASQGDVTGAIQFYNADDTDNTAGVFGMLRGIAGPSGGEGSLQILTDMPSEGADASNITMHFNSNGNVGIGETSPLGKLHIKEDDSGVSSVNSNFDQLVLEDDLHSGMTILSGTSGDGAIYFGDSGSNDIGQIKYKHSSNSLDLTTSGETRLTIDSSGFVHIGATDANHKGLSVKYHAANDSYTPNTFNDFSLLRLNVANAQGNYAGITYTHNGGTEFFTGLVRVGATADITDYVFQGYNGNSNAYQEYMRINSSGQVGIACDDQSNLLTVDANSASSGTDSISVRNRGVSSANHTTGLRFQFNSAVSAAIRSRLTNTSNGAGTLSFYTSPDGSASNLTERANIDSGGALHIGTTAQPGGGWDAHLNVAHDANAAYFRSTGSGGNAGVGIQTGTYTSTTYALVFYNGQQSGAGGVSLANGNASTSVTYNTSSDYRMKENIRPLENGLDRLKQLKPVKFDWKTNDETAEGFIAHEVQEIFPDAVAGEKDGKEMQGMDYGRITPLLVKAIQEQQTIIDDLKSRIKTLEG